MSGKNAFWVVYLFHILVFLMMTGGLFFIFPRPVGCMGYAKVDANGMKPI
jgi:hypothetical protein